MTIATFAKSRGLTAGMIAQKMGVAREMVYAYGRGGIMPTVRTMERIAKAMTELGVPTTPVEVFAALTVKAPEAPADESKTAEG